MKFTLWRHYRAGLIGIAPSHDQLSTSTLGEAKALIRVSRSGLAWALAPISIRKTSVCTYALFLLAR